MKKRSGILSAGLSVLLLLSGSSVTAGALGEYPDTHTQGISLISGCDLSQNETVLSVLRQLCPDGNCDFSQNRDITSVLQQLCPDGNCDFSQNRDITSVLQQLCPDGICDGSVPSESSESFPDIITPPDTSINNPSSPESSSPSDKESPDPITPVISSSDTGFQTAYEAEVIRLVNIERANYGLSPLQQDNGAAAVAHLRAKEIVQSFSHTRPDGRSCFTAAGELGVTYSAAGENIAYGYPDPEQVVRGWMNSEGHRKNILSTTFTGIGVGCYQSGGTLYWTQFFLA